MASNDSCGLAPKASPAKACSARLNIRLEQAELDRIRHRAVQAGVSVSEYVRCRCLSEDERPCIIVDAEELRSLHVLLKRTGNNLNQVARELNTHHKPGLIENLMQTALLETANASEEVALFLAAVRQSI